ncbi:aminopeptidase N isoform X2 [Bradysia coprophila]|uniref:aminopeptidase N isoform X2 n=1 Tax=Bradysia coprophila TaxID=38358 RepID=UPI00187DD0BB|nr:aminopeptidase N isoform X2 [Bradysia coprophila]
MEGGYINEGGQLKSKNGQKYIVNQRPAGVYIPKNCIFFTALLAVIAMIIIIVLTYLLLSQSCSANGNTSLQNDTISKAGLFGATTSNSNSVLSDQSDGNERGNAEIILNDGWNPRLYKLLIEPDFISGTSNGSVSIDVIRDSLEKGLPPIVLDINNITITEAKVFHYPSDIASPLDIETAYGEHNDTFIIDIKRGIDKNDENITLQIQLNFISILTDTLQGFYRASYKDGRNEETKWLASTQFSPIDARRAFPCFDRPDKKAQFQISIIREEDKSMTLSNMPSSNLSFAKPGYIQEDFEITPKMSTYLVAFIVSDLVIANVSTVPLASNLPRINIWTRKEVADMAGYTHDATVKILPFLEEYFGIKYQLPKIDMVAVPDFGFRAMENWGLITFREASILVPENESIRSSAEHTEHVTAVLAHELAHMWFGNLVTMKWWSDLWLKEGFATYMSYLAIEHIEPGWQIMDFFSVKSLQNAMEIDADSSSHPISFPVSKPSDIRRIFDPISYSKGASIIRMMNGFLGEKAFKGGLQAYLNKFQYDNAVQDDLWEVMTNFGHKYNTLPKDFDVKKIMDTWTLQPGYPVVTVVRSGANVTISQQKYMLPAVDYEDTTRWFIPITYETKARRTQDGLPTYWLSNSKNITIPNAVDPTHWMYVNIQRAGYYRVNYDYDSWVILSRSFDEFTPVVRAQLVDDALNLARAEILSYDIPLTFLLRLGNHADALPWAATENSLQYLTYMINREPAYEHFRALMRFILKPIYEKMGFDEIQGESHVELMHRCRIINFACHFGYDRCTNRAQILFRDWMRDKSLNLISPNLKEVIYCTAMREGSFQEWYFAYERYLATTSAAEKELILSALGCTTKPWLLSKYLNMTISSTSGIRKQDGARAFVSVAQNNIGYEIAFDFLVTNIKEISEYFGDGFSTLSKMIDSVTTYMNKDYQKDQFQQFAEKARSLGLKSVESSIKLASEQVKNNIYWRSRSYYKLQEYLETLTRQLHINLY